MDGAALEHGDEEAGDGLADDEREGCEDEVSHPLVYEYAEVEKTHTGFAGRHHDGMDEIRGTPDLQQSWHIPRWVAPDVITGAVMCDVWLRCRGRRARSL